MNYLKDREIWLSNVPTGNPPAGFFWKFIQNGKVVVRDSNGNNQIMVSTSGSQAITGSLTVTEGITGTVSSASYVEYSNVANKPTLVSGSAQVTYSGLTGVPVGIVSGSSQVSFNGIVDKPTLVSGSEQVVYSGLTGIPVGIVSGSAQVAGFGIFATTGSNQFNGSQAITGSLTVTGAIVAQTLNVQQVTSSVVFSSGSNVFGNSLGNTQQFTGSLQVSGSSHYLLGNVGVGIAIPTNPLHIQSNTLSQLNVTALSGNTNAQINLEPTGTGIALIGPANNVDLAFRTNATIKLRLDKDGNLGLGVTPSAWRNTNPAFQIGQSTSLFGYSSSNIGGLASNAFINSSGDEIYIANGFASLYQFGNNGEHRWLNAPSGTAGNAISFTQAMTLDASGRLGIGISTLSNQNGGSLAGSSEMAGILRIQGGSGRYFTTGNGLELSATSIYSYNRGTSAYNDLSINDSITVKGGGGNVGIGTATPGHKLDVRSSSGGVNVIRNMCDMTGDGEQAIFSASAFWSGAERGVSLAMFKHAGIGNPASYVSFRSGASSSFEFLFIDDSSVLRISSTSGNIGTANGTIVGTQTSDIRLKNVKDEFNYGLNEILQINPIAFTFKKDENQVEKLGFSAQEMLTIIPESVYDTNECVDGYTKTEDPMVKTPNSEDTILGMDYTVIIPVLVKAIQEQQTLIESLKSRIEILEQ